MLLWKLLFVAIIQVDHDGAGCKKRRDTQYEGRTSDGDAAMIPVISESLPLLDSPTRSSAGSCCLSKSAMPVQRIKFHHPGNIVVELLGLEGQRPRIGCEVILQTEFNERRNPRK